MIHYHLHLIPSGNAYNAEAGISDQRTNINTLLALSPESQINITDAVYTLAEVLGGYFHFQKCFT